MEADMTPGLRACQRLHVLATNEIIKKGQYTRHSNNLKSLFFFVWYEYADGQKNVVP
jgi:hypothetical protein